MAIQENGDATDMKLSAMFSTILAIKWQPQIVLMNLKVGILYETFIHLKEDEVFKNCIYAVFIICFTANLINVRSVFEKRAKLHFTPIHSQTHDSGNWMERFLWDFHSMLLEASNCDSFKTKIVLNQAIIDVFF